MEVIYKYGPLVRIFCTLKGLEVRVKHTDGWRVCATFTQDQLDQADIKAREVRRSILEGEYAPA